MLAFSKHSFLDQIINLLFGLTFHPAVDGLLAFLAASVWLQSDNQGGGQQDQEKTLLQNHQVFVGFILGGLSGIHLWDLLLTHHTDHGHLGIVADVGYCHHTAQIFTNNNDIVLCRP